MSITIEQATAWVENRAKDTPMPGTREMFKIAADALREKAEREDPKPLTLEELRQMDGEPVWVCDLGDKDFVHCCVVQISTPLKYQDIDHYNSALIPGVEHDWYSFGEYGKTWIAYRYKPKEVTK